MVNDLGGSLDGASSDASLAEKVVGEIRAAGGEAVASTHSVSGRDGDGAIVQTALDAWGRLDVLINNAGSAGAPDRRYRRLEEIGGRVAGVQLGGVDQRVEDRRRLRPSFGAIAAEVLPPYHGSAEHTLGGVIVTRIYYPSLIRMACTRRLEPEFCCSQA